MSYVRDRVIVLKNVPYREHDAWVTMYGRGYGKLVAVARGARRISAKHLGHLEPFTQAEVMIAKGAAIDKIAVARALPGSVPRNHLAALTLSGSFVDLVDRLTRPGFADPPIFLLLEDFFRALVVLPQETSMIRVKLFYAAATFKLLGVLGYAPETQDSLLRFMLRQPLQDTLRITAETSRLAEACLFVAEACSATPLDREPNAEKNFEALLTH